MEVFSKEKFIKVMGEEHYKLISSNNNFNWVDKLDGKEVLNGYVEDFRIHNVWCEKVV